MIVFNLNFGENIKVETGDKGGKFRFGKNTPGLVPTTEGYSITNDWNDRHFTIGFSSNSVFYHLTREVDGGKEAGRGNLNIYFEANRVVGETDSRSTHVIVEE